jgi:hypothetical protein
MTAKDLLHHVFPWEVTTGVERLGLERSADEQADSNGGE